VVLGAILLYARHFVTLRPCVLLWALLGGNVERDPPTPRPAAANVEPERTPPTLELAACGRDRVERTPPTGPSAARAERTPPTIH
jgi:hypothetical protein